MFVLSQLSRNVERACEKLRHAGMRARALSFYLKTQEFTYHGVSLDLPIALADPADILTHIMPHFDGPYAPGVPYRATGITLRDLEPLDATTPDLFGGQASMVKRERALATLDAVNQKYGRGTAFLASSMRAELAPEAAHRSKLRHAFLLTGASRKKSLAIPYLGTAS
jgi:DNA polymerase V